MKTPFIITYSPSDSYAITRSRAAYLLRAGRSRRKGNVLQEARHNYAIADANVMIQPNFQTVSDIPEPDDLALRFLCLP